MSSLMFHCWILILRNCSLPSACISTVNWIFNFSQPPMYSVSLLLSSTKKFLNFFHSLHPQKNEPWHEDGYLSLKCHSVHFRSLEPIFRPQNTQGTCKVLPSQSANGKLKGSSVSQWNSSINKNLMETKKNPEGIS